MHVLPQTDRYIVVVKTSTESDLKMLVIYDVLQEKPIRTMKVQICIFNMILIYFNLLLDPTCVVVSVLDLKKVVEQPTYKPSPNAKRRPVQKTPQKSP